MHRTWRRLTVAFLVAGLLLGMTPPAPGAPAVYAAGNVTASSAELDICGVGSGDATIRGRVTRAGNDVPLQDVTIYLTTFYGDHVRTATSNADGEYVISGLAAGAYVARANPVNINAANPSAPRLLGQVYDRQLTLGTFTPIHVGESAAVTGIDFALIEGGSLRGRVTDLDSGAPLAGAVAVYTAIDRIEMAWHNIPIQSNGYYTLAVGLPPGAYKLRFLANDLEHADAYYDGKGSFDDADAVEIVGTETRQVDMAVTLTPLIPPTDERGTLRGRVTLAENGDGFNLGLARAFSADGSTIGASATPDAAGHYTLTLAPGPYHVKFDPGLGLEVGPDPRDYTRVFFDGAPDVDGATAVSVAANAAVNDIDFALVRGGRIAGRITRATDGEGMGGMTVSVFGSGQSFASAFTQSATTVVNSSGNYVLPALANGVYTVTTLYSSNHCRYPAQRHAQAVTISGPGSVPNIDIALVEGAFITGRVVVSDTNAGIAVPVWALAPGNGDFDLADVRYTAIASPAGHFRLGPLLPGSYQVRFAPNVRSGLAAVYANGVTDRAAAQVFTVASGEIVGEVAVALPPADPSSNPDDAPVYLPTLLGGAP